MKLALIETAEGTPIGGKLFELSPEGMDKAVGVGMVMASENSETDLKIVCKALRDTGDFRDGTWGIHICSVDD